jgi:hypothetical protein
MTPTLKSASSATGRHAVEQGRPQEAAGPFVLNLCSSTTPMALSNPEQPELKRFSFFVSRRFEEGRERFRLHMGYFSTLGEAEEWLGAVRDIYPGAWAGEAPGKKLRERAVAAAAAQAQHAAGPPPHLNVPTVHAASADVSVPVSAPKAVPVVKPAPVASTAKPTVVQPAVLKPAPVAKVAPAPARLPNEAAAFPVASAPKLQKPVAAPAAKIAPAVTSPQAVATPASVRPTAVAAVARPAPVIGAAPARAGQDQGGAVAKSAATQSPNAKSAASAKAPAQNGAVNGSAQDNVRGAMDAPAQNAHAVANAPAANGQAPAAAAANNGQAPAKAAAANGQAPAKAAAANGQAPAKAAAANGQAPAKAAASRSPNSAGAAHSKANAKAAIPNSNVREVLKALEDTSGEPEITGETRMMPAPTLAALDAADDANDFTDTQVLKYLEARKADGTELAGVEIETGAISLLKPDDTGTRRALKQAVADNAPVWFAVQLQWSVAPVELSKVPPLAIFSAYTLYTVEGSRDGRKWYGLRLGFFSDAISAKQVAYYVRSEFTSVAVLPVSPQERTRASDMDKKSEIAFPKKARSGPVDEFKLIDSDDAATSAAPAARQAQRPVATRAAAPAAVARRTPKAPSGRVRAREHRTPQTLEETLEILGAGELEMDTGTGETLNESGVRHLRVEVQKNTPFSRLLERLSERVRKP